MPRCCSASWRAASVCCFLVGELGACRARRRAWEPISRDPEHSPHQQRDQCPQQPPRHSAPTAPSARFRTSAFACSPSGAHAAQFRPPGPALRPQPSAPDTARAALHPRPSRPRLRLARQAPLAQGHQFRVRPASVQSRERFRGLPTDRPHPHEIGIRTRVRGLAGQDGT